jgi:hypothetical protein
LHVGENAMRHLQSRLIRRALEVTGGFSALCARLGANEHAVRMWLDNRATAPTKVLHELIDLILEDDVARAAQDRRQQPRTQESRGH